MIVQAIRDHFFTRQFIVYGLIGLSGVAVDIALFFILTSFFGIPPVVATFISVSAGIVNNFFLNRNYNFKKKDKTLVRFLSFYAVGATGILLSMLFIVLFQDIIGTSTGVAKLVSVPFIVVFQFWFNKQASFGEKAGTIPVKQLVIFLVCLACLVVSGINGPHAYFSDEHDNLLGGRLISEGQVIYKDFFSHHMPLQYFAATPFYILFGANLIATKVVFGLLLAVWLLTFSRHIYKRYGLVPWIVFVGMLSVTQMLTWANMFLAETFVAYAMAHLLVLFWTRRSNAFNWRTLVTYTLLASIPVLSSFSFIWLSLLGYVLLLIHGWSWFFPKKTEALSIVKRLALAVIILAAPYILLVCYLAANGALSFFVDDAFRFNTLYYSQFVTEVGRSTTESLYVQANSVLNGIYTVIFMPENGKILLRSFFLFSLFGAGLLTVINKKWLGLTVLSVAFVILASVRDGIINAFLPGRSGTILTVVGMAILCLYVFEIRKNRSSDGFEKTVSVGIAALFALILVSTSLVFTGSVHDYRYHNNLTSIPDGPGNVANVVNVVNKNSDTYWLGPMDFYSQILITSHNASRYTFYLPWHAACPECKQELLNDLKTKQPNVVYWEDAGAIHGHPTAEYGKDIKDFLQASGYYRVTDGRLAFFYFNPNNKAEIDQKLKDAGFAL